MTIEDDILVEGKGTENESTDGVMGNVACDFEGDDSITDDATECAKEDANIERSNQATLTNVDPACQLTAPENIVKTMLAGLKETVETIHDKQDENSLKLLAMHTDYKNAFADVVANMQKELDEHRRGLKKDLMRPFVKFLAELYSENVDIISLEQGENREKRIDDLFQDILDYLERYDVVSHISKNGTPYSRRFCRVVGKIEVPDDCMHGMVAESRCVGFHIDNEVIIPERVKIFVKTASVENACEHPRCSENISGSAAIE
jgi:hypothetical protein